MAKLGFDRSIERMDGFALSQFLLREWAVSTEPVQDPIDFRALIAPLGFQAFFETYWEKRPYYLSRAVDDFYQSLLTTDDLERIVSSTDLRYPALEVARGGNYIAAESYTRNIKYGGAYFNGVPDIERVKSEYYSGATIVLPALHRTWTPLRNLCNRIEDELSHPVHANAYMTPGGSEGFTPHYDTHEVFVLQIAGEKHWKVYLPTLQLPNRNQPFNATTYKLPLHPSFEVTLKPGDLLYLPRGFVHCASTSNRFSAHVTVGITPYTWIELLAEFLSTAHQFEGLRNALPPGFSVHEHMKASIGAGLSAKLNEMQTKSDLEKVVSSLAQRVRGARFRPCPPFRLDVRLIDRTTPLRAIQRSRYSIRSEGSNCILSVDGRSLALPAALHPIVDAIACEESFTIDQLPKQFDDVATLAFVRYLYGESFLELVN